MKSANDNTNAAAGAAKKISMIAGAAIGDALEIVGRLSDEDLMRLRCEYAADGSILGLLDEALHIEALHRERVRGEDRPDGGDAA